MLHAMFHRLLVAIMLLASLIAAPAGAEELPERLIVHFASGQGRFAADALPVSHWVRSDVAVVNPARQRLRNGNLQTEMAAWRQQAGVRYVERDAVGHFDALSDVAAPNDPQFSQQTWLPLVGAQGLWALGTGKSTVVAVIDSGVDLTHPDLAANLLSNGYSFGDSSANAQDLLGHGTFVAGILAAVNNNGIGVSGLAPGVKILPIKINSGSSGTFYASTVAQAIDYAVAQGVKIINLSITVDTDVQLMQQSLQNALTKGVIVVAAAGNKGGAVEFPANVSGVVAVANTNSDGTLNTSSARGAEIAVAAPGVLPVSTLLGGGYGNRGSGTSYASPMVAAALAVLLTANPNLTQAQLLAQLQATATPVSGYSFGVLQAGKAAARIVPDLEPAKSSYASGEFINLSYQVPITGTAADIYVAIDTPYGTFSLLGDGSWSAVASNGYLPLARGYNGSSSASGTLFGNGGLYASIPVQGLPAGDYTWRIALLESSSQRLLGTVVPTVMRVQ